MLFSNMLVLTIISISTLQAILLKDNFNELG